MLRVNCKTAVNKCTLLVWAEGLISLITPCNVRRMGPGLLIKSEKKKIIVASAAFSVRAL